ncbi:hypothetical protein NX059_001249 [Plenodomus lindquistii]|nr:hypothetical protein NX059_001249 [Plenodomus lindquistii]
MAPIQSPELDLAKCFTGEQQLVYVYAGTWDIAYRALCDPETASRSDALRAFLTSQENVDMLSRPWNPFADPSTQEKSRFDSKTAPINVTPSPNGHYDIEEIKRDSLWLSQLAQISEYAALQIVVQEWQGRSSTQLLSGLTQEEALSVQDAAGVANLGASTFMPNSSILTRPLAARNNNLQTEHLRQLRIISIYHSTCASVIRVSQLLVSWASAAHLRSQTSYGNNYMNFGAGWIQELGQRVASQQNGGTPTSGAKALDECLIAVSKRVNSLDRGCDISVDPSIWETACEYWLVAQTTEMLHLLHLAFVHADLVVKGFVPAVTVEDWLGLFSDRGFFRDFPVMTPRQAPLIPIIQVLTSLVSLAILKADAIFEDLSSGDYKQWEPSCYILNTVVVENITTMFARALEFQQSPATPAILAWGILLYILTGRASEEEQERERLLESQPSISQNPAPTQLALEECALAIRGLDGTLFSEQVTYEALASHALDLGAIGTVAQFAEICVPAFGTDIDRISRDRLRLLYLQLIKITVGSNVVSYCDEIVTSSCTLLAGEKTFRNWVDSDASQQFDPVVAYLLEDEDVLRPSLLDHSRLRYPYETRPFLQFCSVLTRGDKTQQNGVPTFIEKLTNASRLMQAMPPGFSGYKLTREEENKDWVELTEPLPLFMPKPKSTIGSQRRLLLSNGSANAENTMSINRGTEGIRIDGGKQPEVAIWYHQHATLPYLCQLLSTYPIASQTVESFSKLPAPCTVVGDIIGLFANLLHASLRCSEGICSNDLLENLSISTDSNRDTISIVLAIFEEELLRLAKEPNNEASLELLVKCTQFLEAIVIITPHRVWPWLARSRLLEGDGSGSLATVLIGTEMVLGRYDFLIGCIRIYKRLVKDAVQRSVSRKVPTKALSRFNAPAPSESGTSDKIISTVLFTFGRTLASIYETSLSWKYSNLDHRPEINIAICEVFTTILKYAYGVDDSPQLSAKLTKSIAPIAEYLVQLYTTASNADVLTSPILSALVIGVSSDDITLLTSSSALWTRQTRSTLIFSDLLVRIAVLLNKPWTRLEQQLFKATPLLARLYATSDVWKSQVVLLLEALVRGAVRVAQAGDADMADGDGAQSVRKQKDQQEPPSLLGHLGPRTAKNFLSVLSQLDEPLKTVDIQTNVWNLLSAVVTCKQQWFSLYLLTGNTPRESLRTKSDTASNTGNRALLTRALDSLLQMTPPKKGGSSIQWPLYTAMLEFVSSAQNNWSWAMGDLRDRKNFIQVLLNLLGWMATQPKTPRTNLETLERSYQNKFASLACEVISMDLHRAGQAGDITALKDIVPKLDFLEDNALDLPTYNSSLHSWLQKNFEKHYPGVSLSNLKRTTLYPEAFGKAFFYDAELGKQLLSFDSKWDGPREGAGMAGDLEKANFNLGLVESQVLLLQGWKLLTLELSQVVGKDERLVRILNGVITKCMLANTQSNLPEALFGKLMIVRADLAFALLKKLVDAKTSSPETRKLLTPVWNAIRATTADFDSVFSSESVYYYRSLLRILYLALHFHLVSDIDDSEETIHRSSFRGSVPASRHTLVESPSTLLLEILTDTVAKGFRSLANQLHAEPSSVSPSDFALLTALLQRILAVPEMSKWQSQAALLFANHNTTRFATSLFSWADKLTISHNGIQDPVYGELSILFLLSLSSIPALAETMAVDGVLSQLNTANITAYFRRAGGMGPFDHPVRMHSIWTKGLLPLCLNLLLSIGPPIAAEISSFLNQFPEQLLRASSSINSSASARAAHSKITLGAANEIHSLALLSTIIEDVRRQGPKLGIQSSEVMALEWDAEPVKEDLEAWLGRRGALGERVVPVDEREVEMVGRRGEGGGNELEERVWRELEGAAAVLGVGRGK